MDNHPVTAIADLCMQCNQNFSSVKRQASTKANDDISMLPEGFSPALLIETYARFRVWTGNIGALRRGRAALDYRIRHTDVRNEVVRLLNQMLLALTDLATIISGEREQATWYAGEDFPTDFSHVDSDSSESQKGIPTPEEDNPNLITESAQLEEMLNDTTRSLLKLSIIIQKSSRRAKFARSSRENAYDTKFDISHALESFPHAANNTVLMEKLGKANAQRRQWLSYRRRHRDKLSSTASSNIGQFSSLNIQSADAESLPATEMASTMSFSTRPPLSSVTGDQSTTATTFYEGQGGKLSLLQEGEVASEISFSASSVSGGENEPVQIPRLPPGAAIGDPFECPLCFQIASVGNLQAWIKHVHADLASYVCTFEHCAHPMFESRLQWFDHEMEVHRRQWNCLFCDTPSTTLNELEVHMLERHSGQVHQGQVRAMAKVASQPIQRIPASACPLCDYEGIIRSRVGPPGASGQILIKPEQFRSHLGRHLEQLALFVLPKSTLIQDREEKEDDRPLSPSASAASEGSEDEDGGNESTDFEMKLEHIHDILALHSQIPPHILESAPALALGWQPPHDFTPPAQDFETDDPDLIPRREEPIFGGDLFTPGWVRGYDKMKEGYCARCKVFHWVNIPSGEYEFHLTYLHGLPNTGLPLPRPSAIREVEGKAGSWEAYCDMCQGWRILRKTQRGWNWWRHCLTEHESIIAPSIASKPVEPIAPVVASQNAILEKKPLERAVDCIRLADFDTYSNIVNGDPGVVLLRDSEAKVLLHYTAEVGHIAFLRLTLHIFGSLESTEEFWNVIDAQSHKGWTALMLAVEQGNYDATEELLNHHANVELISKKGTTALDIAAHAGYNSIAKLLIEYSAKVKHSKTFQEIFIRPTPKEKPRDPTLSLSVIAESDSANWTEIMALASRNDVFKLEARLQIGEDIETPAKDGRTALMIAVEHSSYEAAQMLIAQGANLNATNSKGWTSLMLVTRVADYSAVQFLLRNGADANHLSPDHWTALAESASSGFTNILEILLAHDADPEVHSSHDWTPLMHACYRGDKACVKILLEAGAGIENGSEHDESPMLLAAAAGHTEVIRILFEKGGLPESAWARRESSSKRPEQSAQEAIERSYQLGWTPLMVASQNGHEEIVRMLLEVGANVKPRSPLKRTALEIAKENGQTSILKVLEAYSKTQSL